MSSLIGIPLYSIVFMLIFVCELGAAFYCYECNTSQIEEVDANCGDRDNAVECPDGCFKGVYKWRYMDYQADILYKGCTKDNGECPLSILEPSLDDSVLVQLNCDRCESSWCNSSLVIQPLPLVLLHCLIVLTLIT